MGSFLQSTCLKTSNSLRTQLLLSFGISSFITIVIVVIVACTCAILAGQTVKNSADQLMRGQVTDTLLLSSQLVADKFDAYMRDVEGTVQLLVEAVQDRIVGYPYEGWVEDSMVPFVDEFTGTRQYPWQQAPAPMEWQIDININQSNAAEHAQERAPWLLSFPGVTSASASYFQQGACDPSVIDPSSRLYFPNCTDANNDVQTGGVVQPTNTNYGLYLKSGDLSVFMKALWESQYDALVMGIFFHNSGAGSKIMYPGNHRDGSAPPYVSMGCDWMQEINNYTGEPFGTSEEIARCHPAGTLVPQREFNAMEKPWAREMALNPHRVVWYGPFLLDGSGTPTMIVGKSIFDQITGNFIGLATLDVTIFDLTKQLDATIQVEDSILSLVRLDDGIIVADSINSIYVMNKTGVHISETGLMAKDTFQAFQQLVNFSDVWSKGQVNDAFRASAEPCDECRLMTAYPLPVPPDTYDPSYRPLFLIINLVSESIFDVVAYIDESIDHDVQQICVLAAGLGIVGILIIISLVWCVSRMLTQPLLWMESVAWRVVNHADKRAGDGLQVVNEDAELPSATIRCTPKTEINEIVSEFRTMISGFSGTGASQVAYPPPHQIQNCLTWHSDLSQLYSRHKRKSFLCANGSFNSELTDEESAVSPVRALTQRRPEAGNVGEDGAVIVPAPMKRNVGFVVSSPLNPDNTKPEEPKHIRLLRSPLFWWILVLIVLPLLLTNAVICVIVSHDIVTIIPSWVNQADESSYLIELHELNMTAQSRAALMTALVYESVRDLHLMTRVTSWLAFRAVNQSASFTAMENAAEECKHYWWATCPYYFSADAPCPCEWKDLNSNTCSVFGNFTVAREKEKLFYGAEKQDTDPVTGARSESQSFPTLGSSPNTTFWWSNLSEMPGFTNGSTAGGYATTFDRVRLASATAAVMLPIYNYATSLGRTKHNLGMYVGFQADGMFTGFNGCVHPHASLSYWKSDEGNQAFAIAEQLCPFGKYGYDPRCRDWYATGHKLYETSTIPVHVTAPYLFALVNDTAASATSPLANPATGEYGGQILLDFYPSGLRQALEGLDVHLSILITPEVDATGGDTVVGPDKTKGWDAAAISDLLFPYDPVGSLYRDQFEVSILTPMKSGTSGLKEFTRTLENETTENLMLAFAPVYERVLLPLDPSDFSRGVNVSHVLLYSVGIARHTDSLHQPFVDIEDDIGSSLHKLRAIYIAVTILVSVAFTIFTCFITMNVASPMITLLHAVKSINSGQTEEGFPPLVGGSREIHRVYNTFAKLYKVVRVSNTAFFSGNLKWAFHFVGDALRLFRKVEDKKAVGIASNNLGNVLFAIHYDAVGDFELNEEGYAEDSQGDESSLITLALRHFDEAVELAQQDFDQAPDTELKCDFALQLSDRLFNRGLFCLLVDGDEDAPIDCRERGYTDIRRSRNLDYDAKDFWMARKLLLKNSDAYFARLIRRINGLADFYDDIGLREVWDVKELIDDADQLLFAAWNEANAPLFEELNRVGRLQELEGAAILLWLRMGNELEAARLAMRMFSEDQYILEAAFVRAGEALLRVLRDGGETLTFSKKAVSCAREDLRRMAKSCKNVSLDVGKCLVFAVELGAKWEGDPLLEKINENCLRLYDRHCAENDYMGLAAFSTKESLTVELGMKDGNEGRQRTLLDIATSSTAEGASPAFPLAVQMVVDAQASLDNDSYIILILDGHAWASETCATIQSQIDRLNQERNTSIHLFILGLAVEDEGARSQCHRLCSVSKQSFYIDVSWGNADIVFDAIADSLTSRQRTNGFLRGITMERF